MLGCKVRLFTMTMLGHAKEVGSTNVAKKVEAFDPNAINRCRSKNMGFIGMIKRLLALFLRGGTISLRRIFGGIRGSGAYRKE